MLGMGVDAATGAARITVDPVIATLNPLHGRRRCRGAEWTVLLVRFRHRPFGSRRSRAVPAFVT